MKRQTVRQAFLKSVPVMAGYIVLGTGFGILMRNIDHHARKYGYDSILMTTNEEEDLEKHAIQAALNKNVDGIIICPCQKSDRNIRYLQSVKVPFVLRTMNLQLPLIIRYM